MTKLVLRNFQAPGDVLMLTAAVRDLKRATGDKYRVHVQTNSPELWDNNPYVEEVIRTRGRQEARGVRVVNCRYELFRESNTRPYHFLHGFVQDLEQQLGERIPVTEFKADIHLSEAERRRPPFDLPDRYWLIVAGGKSDMTCKWWDPAGYQRVVDELRGEVEFVQVGLTGRPGSGQLQHFQWPLERVTSLVDRTQNLRQLIQLMRHAEGVVCPVTMMMHLCAAVPMASTPERLRPCVVIAGGRESPTWEAYPGHQFLHTVGQLDCCASGGCWKARCQTIGDRTVLDRKNLCPRPVQVSSGMVIPECMTLISPSLVVDSVRRCLKFTVR